MDIQYKRWEKFYSAGNALSKDRWLENYENYFRPGTAVLDLGCGNGSNISYLMSKSADIHACDYSESAVRQVMETFGVKAVKADFREGLPFPDSFFDIVVSDLSLHYFSREETAEIVAEMRRITKRSGIVLARLNSVHDRNFGAGEGVELERNFYDINGDRKRFFDREMIDFFFGSSFSILDAEEKKTDKYRKTKHVWEIVLKRGS